MTVPAFTPQRAVGWWAETETRKMMWAVDQTLIYVERTVPEWPQIDSWQTQLAQLIREPVDDYDWAAWFQRVSKGDKPALPDGFGTDVWVQQVVAAVGKLIDQAGHMRTDQMGVPFPEEAFAAAIASTMEQVAGIADTLKDTLRTLMRDTLDAEQTQFQFASKLRAGWDEFAGPRARLIAVTEWNRGASAATYESYVAMGVQTKSWGTVGDNRVCSLCEENAAMGEIGINEEFFTGDLYPPAHPGCRCNVMGGIVG